MLDEYDESDSLPLDDPEPDELSRFFFACGARLCSTRAGGGEMAFFRFSVGIGEAAFLSTGRARTALMRRREAHE